ncbi:hypothetical protein EJB05_25725, partial [Eragrostis curvula]
MELVVGASEATLKSLLGKLGNLLAEEYALSRGVRGDIQFITDELASMQCFLSNLSKSDESHDDQTEGWMRQVRDVAYDIEDCIDDFAHNLDGDPRGNGWVTVVRRTLYEIRTWWPRRNIALKISDLKERAQHVGDRRGRYGVPDPNPCKNRGNTGANAGDLAAEHLEITRQLVGIKQPVGVKEMPDLEKWVLDDKRRPQLGVLSIVGGFGGVGKTTIAMALYQKFGPQFDRRAMVTVSQNTDPEVLLGNILSQVKLEPNEEQQCNDSTDASKEKKIPVIGSILNQINRLSSQNQKENSSAVEEKLDQMKTELESYLKTTRYLLLIDDVWSTSTWQNIRKCFPESNRGSRIIVTTRIQSVATTCSARKPHDIVHPIEVLTPVESKNLFQKTLSEWWGTEDSQPIRPEIPDRVWQMCGGLPLAIVTMAGLVASKPKKTGKEWSEDCESLFPNEQECRKPEDFMRMINYCYNDLPSDVKVCSLYLSIFPKGSKISRKRLIRRWIAEGFVSEKQGLGIEDVAEVCFNQLVKRKIIRPVEHNSNGRVKSCHVHDMVLEYIISKAAEEDFITVVGSHWSMPTRSNKVRRLSIHSSDPKRAKNVDRMNLSHVRSLTVFGSLVVPFKSFKTGIVQVLDLDGYRGFRESNINISDICEMTLLKYLSLRRTDVEILPKNIYKLKYLETLDIRETEIQQLPATIRQLERINNILGGDKRMGKTLKLPNELKGTMKTLRILSGVEIIEGSTASDLGYFTGLRKLAIYRLHKSEEVFKDLLSSIQYLSGYSLQILIVHDESSEFLKTLDSMSSYPTDLRALELSGKLLKLPIWLKSLEGLVKLTLSVTALRTDNLLLIGNLSSLFSLTFSISEKQDPAMVAILEKNKSDSGGEIFVPAGGFTKLKLLRIFSPIVPSIHFNKKATPKLERIELRFKRLEGLYGMDELGMLNYVLLTVDGQASDETKSLVMDLKQVKNSSSKYAVAVNEYLN